MGSKSKKRQQKRAAEQAAQANAKPAKAPVNADAKPAKAEEVVAAIVESIAPALFEDARAKDTDGAISSTRETASVRMSMRVEIGLGSETHFFSGLSGDVSKGGVFVQTYQEIPVGSEVEVELALPTGHVTTHGTVRWHRSKSESAPPGIGVRHFPVRARHQRDGRGHRADGEMPDTSSPACPMKKAPQAGPSSMPERLTWRPAPAPRHP